MKEMNDVTYTAHPSVRIRGTENDYIPTECCDPKCCQQMTHMHCPFCINTELYQDPVILRAHYRVKHVDKGIDFAGLRILRCCQQCDIVGAIKGEKKFKGAHWHCYKCRNGFNRRDEAVKHYRTHFRNPLTTFQIHIAQEVNVPLQNYESTEMTGSGLDTMLASSNDETFLGGQTIVGEVSYLDNENQSSIANGHLEEMQVSVQTSESIRVDPGTKAIMIIREEHMEPEAGELTLDADATDCTTMFVTTGQQLLSDKSRLDKKVVELERLCEELRLEKVCVEAELRSEIEQLKLKNEAQAKEIEVLTKKEEKWKKYLMGPIDDQTQQLLDTLREQHEELLQQQLIQLRKVVLVREASNHDEKDTTSPVLDSSDLSTSIAGTTTTTDENR